MATESGIFCKSKFLAVALSFSHFSPATSGSAADPSVSTAGGRPRGGSVEVAPFALGFDSSGKPQLEDGPVDTVGCELGDIGGKGIGDGL
jgi:hypothetical protein